VSLLYTLSLISVNLERLHCSSGYG